MYKVFFISKNGQDADGEVTVRVNVCFSKPLIMSPRNSVNLNLLDFEIQISRKLYDAKKIHYANGLVFVLSPFVSRMDY